jgi:hypothetical protein
MKCTIAITQKHIEAGLRESFHSCAVALAMSDAGLGAPGVNAFFIEGVSNGEHLSAVTPGEVRQFVDDFDHGRPVSPFSFEVDLTA